MLETNGMKIDLRKFELNLNGNNYKWVDLYKIYSNPIKLNDETFIESMAIKRLYPIMTTAEYILDNVDVSEEEAFVLAQKVRFVMEDEHIAEDYALEIVGIEFNNY